ncbi:MAG: hypothetical protein MR471_03680 [Clostridia bacterium]|nr:hypothetical protein [Clostridia bacterium]MDY3784438.1 hypothetical protein [Eubacteriales bacterium]
MQLDRNAINKLLSLNDFQLKIVISRLLKENGIDPSMLNIDTKNMASIRRSLENATDEDIKRATDFISGFKGNGG